MRKNFSIIPVEGEKNKVEITFRNDFKITVDKTDNVFVKFLMMVLDSGGGAPAYFAPLLESNEHSFYDIKKKFETEGIVSLFYDDIKNQPADKLSNANIGKVIRLLIDNPRDSYKQISDKFNETSNTRIDSETVENICKKFGLKVS